MTAGFKCHKCDKTYNLKRNLTRHIRFKHDDKCFGEKNEKKSEQIDANIIQQNLLISTSENIIPH
jgi:hypothetical protein